MYPALTTLAACIAAVSCNYFTPMLAGVKSWFWLTGKLGSAWGIAWVHGIRGMPCTMPCTHAMPHAGPSLPVNQNHNLTLANIGVKELHDTAASYYKTKSQNGTIFNKYFFNSIADVANYLYTYLRWPFILSHCGY